MLSQVSLLAVLNNVLQIIHGRSQHIITMFINGSRFIVTGTCTGRIGHDQRALSDYQAQLQTVYIKRFLSQAS
jgi:hypothetical protein